MAKRWALIVTSPYFITRGCRLTNNEQGITVAGVASCYVYYRYSGGSGCTGATNWLLPFVRSDFWKTDQIFTSAFMLRLRSSHESILSHSSPTEKLDDFVTGALSDLAVCVVGFES
jgi:hypothetical protein